MSLASIMVAAAERAPWPDFVLRAGIAALCGRTKTAMAAVQPGHEQAFARDMQNWPIAVATEAANSQHYELPPEFFAAFLGPNRKYSCCLFENEGSTLAQAEDYSLRETCIHADLQNGQRILELGCGWGSLSLWMAQRFPAAQILAVSNSTPQRLHIEARRDALGLANLRVETADMNRFETSEKFDRIVSVEMFEHMSNWRDLLSRGRGWLQPEGRMFLHVFTHRTASYRFDENDPADWIAQYFFTGGIMPGHGLIREFADLFSVEQEWRWSGWQYARTAQCWLANFDAARATIDPILLDVYGADAALWRRRWRMFLLATEGLFGHSAGQEWGVSHYRLKPA